MYLTDDNYKMVILWGLIGLCINGFGLFSKNATKPPDENKLSDEEE